jgi:hypothetical protein
MNHTCESLNAVFRAELPGWQVYDQSEYAPPGFPYSVARRGEWVARLTVRPDRLVCVIAMDDDDDREFGEKEISYESTPNSYKPDPTTMLRAAIAKVREWVAALQEGCP